MQYYPSMPIALFGWAPLVVLMFLLRKGRGTVITTFLLGWLFLPMAGFPIPSFISFSKGFVVPAAVLLATLLREPDRLFRLRPRWVDLPMLLWLLAPLGAGLADTSIEFKEGVFDALDHLFTWGVPYLLGRAYFADFPGLRQLARGIFLGGLIYAPLCLWEVRMSPELHALAYGFAQHSFAQTVRFGGYRPMLFMQHGLAVAMWMAAASLAGVWLWVTGALPRRLAGLPVGLWLALLLGTTLLCKSVGAVLLLGAALGTLLLVKRVRRKWLLVPLLAVAPLYLAARASGLWDGQVAVEVTRDALGGDRAESLEYRLDSENMLLDKARGKALFGWGPAGRFLVYDMWGTQQLVPDAMWVIAFGSEGVVGLIGFFLMLLAPAWLFWRRFPSKLWGHPMAAGAVALLALVAICAIDFLMNAMPNPIFLLAVGGLAGLGSAIHPRRSLAARAAGAGGAMGRGTRGIGVVRGGVGVPAMGAGGTGGPGRRHAPARAAVRPLDARVIAGARRLTQRSASRGTPARRVPLAPVPLAPAALPPSVPPPDPAGPTQRDAFSVDWE